MGGEALVTLKNLKITLALFLAFGSLLFATPGQAAMTGAVSITCAKNGTQGTYQVGWDNSNQFFQGKGDIAKLYCEGGFSPLGAGATYVSDTLTNNSLRYYNGIIPEPTPTASESPSVSQSVSPSVSPDVLDDAKEWRQRLDF